MTSLNVVINHPGQAHYVDGDLPSRSASRRITYRGVKHSECIGWCELASRNSQVISVRGRRVKMRGLELGFKMRLYTCVHDRVIDEDWISVEIEPETSNLGTPPGIGLTPDDRLDTEAKAPWITQIRRRLSKKRALSRSTA
ncbi:hypothetical protein AAMO2058_000995600 [Amorphochlora amoebiformis]